MDSSQLYPADVLSGNILVFFLSVLKYNCFHQYCESAYMSGSELHLLDPKYWFKKKCTSNFYKINIQRYDLIFVIFECLENF